MEMLKKTKVINELSAKLVSLTGKTADRITVIKKIILTQISCAQPVEIFLAAA